MKQRKAVPVERQVSDKGKLLYTRFIGPAQLAINAMQQVLGESQKIVVEHLAEWDGVPLKDGWALDVERMVWVKVPKVKLAE